MHDTLGLPKGVELTHYNLVAVCCQMLATPHAIRPAGEDPSNDIVLGVMPHYHVYGGVMLIFHPLAHNTPSLILPKFEPEPYLAAIQKYRPAVSSRHLIRRALRFA
jgi:4-coumarate--CoA ligase